VSCAKNGWTFLTICMSYDLLLHKELPFGVAVIATVLKLLVALILLIAIHSLTC